MSVHSAESQCIKNWFSKAMRDGTRAKTEVRTLAGDDTGLWLEHIVEAPLGNWIVIDAPPLAWASNWQWL